jgi:glycosyltransferase involved in cell wall biosynthesis
MKLIFDARYIRTDFHDGISRYSAELAAALAATTPVTFLVHSKKQLHFLPADTPYIMFHAPTSWREPFSPLLLNRHQPDVVFSPMQTIGSFGRRFKLILTLHDLIYYRHRTPPSSLPWLVRVGWRLFHLSYAPQRSVLNAADIVATVSETSKQDILTHKLTKRPVIVVPNAPQQLANLLSREITQTKPTNLIYMGSFMRYKNVETLIDGMALLPGYTLHLLSRIKPDRQKALTKRLPKGASVVFHNGVTDAQYAELLADNALLVSASLDEGYGLPIAESLALGVPVVTSNLDIFHEVAGPGALYFPADDPELFASAVQRASDPSAYAKLSKDGSAHVKNFSWKASAKTLLIAVQTLARRK